MQNIEFKAELRDLDLARTLLKKIHATPIDTLEQTDTYYRLTDGRLKKRETKGQPTEVIFYHRENAAKARVSRFTIYSESQARQHFGSEELPVWLKVVKVREVYMHSGVRIHLDRVEGLGTFIEFEALVTAQFPQEACYQAVALLKQALLPVMGEMLSHSYCDMIAVDH
jgi:predicted adenylyl cyclase CyaB